SFVCGVFDEMLFRFLDKFAEKWRILSFSISFPSEKIVVADTVQVIIFGFPLCFLCGETWVSRLFAVIYPWQTLLSNGITLKVITRVTLTEENSPICQTSSRTIFQDSHLAHLSKVGPQISATAAYNRPEEVLV